MADKIKVGIIGMGAIGAVHADAYVLTGQADLAALCDVNDKRLAAEAARLGVKTTYTDYHKLLANKDIQAVSVCVGNALHKKVAIAALAAGKHVLLEKPMALDSIQAAAICQEAAKAKGILQMGMINRHRAESQILRDWVVDGSMGDIYHMRCVWVRRRGIPGLGGWFTTRKASGGGPMIDLGVHLFDLAMFISGHWNPTSVSAQTYAKFGPKMRDYKFVGMWAGPPKYDGVFDVEDYSTGFVRFGGKATLSFEISWAANAKEETYVEILGTKGGARVMDSQPLQVLTEHNGHLADILPQYDSKANTWKTQMTKFLSACRGEIEPVATARQGCTLMKLLDSIYKSGKQGKEVPVK
jgi:predicted dehydrogenase